jgi:pimeloyl-ACP methyl ester carboxylesterase
LAVWYPQASARCAPTCLAAATRTAFPEYITQFQPQLQYRGFKRAVLPTLRSSILSNHEEVYRRVGQQNLPILVIWGREDQVIPFVISQQVLALLPGVECIVVEQAGHVPHYERPEVVNPRLIEFLNRPSLSFIGYASSLLDK